MQYFGGKAKIAKELSVFLQSKIEPNQTFVDLFCGSCNIVSKIKADKRIANDLHKELIALHIAVQQGWIPPEEISEQEYKLLKYDLDGNYSDHMRGFVGFGLSYGGKWFGGYARNYERVRNYSIESWNSLKRKHENLIDVNFTNLNYSQVEIPDVSLIYCDIPYKDTTKYSTGSFDHEAFYSYAKQKQSEGHVVYVSEYEHNVPEGWEVIWRYESTKSIRNKDKVQEKTVEVLMTPL